MFRINNSKKVNVLHVIKHTIAILEKTANTSFSKIDFEKRCKSHPEFYLIDFKVAGLISIAVLENVRKFKIFQFKYFKDIKHIQR